MYAQCDTQKPTKGRCGSVIGVNLHFLALLAYEKTKTEAQKYSAYPKVRAYFALVQDA